MALRLRVGCFFTAASERETRRVSSLALTQNRKKERGSLLVELPGLFRAPCI